MFAERFAQVAPKLVFRGALLPYPSGGAAALPDREYTPAPVPCPRLGCVRAVQGCLPAEEYLHEEAFADQALLLKGAFTLRPFCGPHNANCLFSTAVLPICSRCTAAGALHGHTVCLLTITPAPPKLPNRQALDSHLPLLTFMNYWQGGSRGGPPRPPRGVQGQSP